VGAVGVGHIADEHQPEALNRHLVPYDAAGCGIAIVHGQQQLIPLSRSELRKAARVQVKRDVVDGPQCQVVCVLVGRHIARSETWGCGF
jgi:hypothetical protein